MHKRNWGKELKDVGTLIIVLGCVMLGLVLYTLFIASGNESSFIIQKVEEHFFLLTVDGLVLALIGVIVRSVSKSKEERFNSKQES